MLEKQQSDLITQLSEYPFILNILQFAKDNPFILYIFLFLSAIIENLFPPIPGDTITVIGAVIVGTGSLNFYMVFLATTLGSVVGFVGLFLLGRKLGRPYFEKKNFKYFSIDNLNKLDKWFNKYGYWTILFNRFLPGVRSVISLGAGISRMNVTVVIILATISSSIWNGVLIYVGSYITSNIKQIEKYIKEYNIIAGSIIVCVILFFVIRYIIKKRKSKLNNENSPRI